MTAVDLPYRIAWRSRAARVGAHPSAITGSGGMYRDLASLLETRDPRRIDLRQTLRDPFGQVHVRRFEQKSAITVTLLADVSGSLAFSGRTRKIRLVRELAAVLAESARRTGDAYALIGANSEVCPELVSAPTRSRSATAHALAALGAFVPKGAGSGGLLDAVRTLSPRRGLVFVVSDFLWPEATIAALFEQLGRHDVVPIALHDSAELEALPEWGLIELADLETARRRFVVMRPSLKAAWRRQSEQRRAVFRSIARRFGHAPFEVTDRIDWDRLAAHLVAGRQ